MDIIIFGGQSNMQGQTECIPTENAPIVGAKEYKYSLDRMTELRHPVGEYIEDCVGGSNHSDGAPELYWTCGSMLPYFCDAYVKASGRKVCAVHAAKGATVIAEWAPNTARYRFVIKKIRAAVEAVKKKDSVHNILYIWLQGESDALAGTSEEEYFERLIKYKNALKKDAGIDKFAIIKVGYFSKEHSRDDAIMRAQERACEVDGDFVMLTRICTELSLTQKYINPHAEGHYNNAAMEIIGAVAGEALARV